MTSTEDRTAGTTPPWQRRWDRAWAEIGNPPHPRVSQMGTPTDVAAREWAALVASGRPRPATGGR